MSCNAYDSKTSCYHPDLTQELSCELSLLANSRTLPWAQLLTHWCARYQVWASLLISHCCATVQAIRWHSLGNPEVRRSCLSSPMLVTYCHMLSHNAPLLGPSSSCRLVTVILHISSFPWPFISLSYRLTYFVFFSSFFFSSSFSSFTSADRVPSQTGL